MNDDDKYLAEYYSTKMNYNISFNQIVIPGELISQTDISAKIKVLSQYDESIIQMIERQIYYIFEIYNPNELYMVQNLLDQLKIQPPDQIPYFTRMISVVKENEDSRFRWKVKSAKYPQFLVNFIEKWFQNQKQKLAFEYNYTYVYYKTFESYHFQHKKVRKGAGTVIEISRKYGSNCSLICKLSDADENHSEAFAKRYQRINEIIDNFHEEMKYGDVLPILSELCQEFDYSFAKLIQTDENEDSRKKLVKLRNITKKNVNKFINNSILNVEKYINLYGVLIPVFMVLKDMSNEKTEYFYMNFRQLEYLKKKFPDDGFFKNVFHTIKKHYFFVSTPARFLSQLINKEKSQVEKEVEMHNEFKEQANKAKPIIRDIIDGTPNCDNQNFLIKIEKNSQSGLNLVGILHFLS